MKTMGDEKSNQHERAMSSHDRIFAIISHLSAAIPLWGVIANASLFFTFRESSRLICLHARQGIVLQLFYLLAGVCWIATEIFSRLMTALQVGSAVTDVISGMGQLVLAVATLTLSALCFCGAVQSWRGCIFAYPLIGKNSYREYLQATRNKMD